MKKKKLGILFITLILMLTLTVIHNTNSLYASEFDWDTDANENGTSDWIENWNINANEESKTITYATIDTTKAIDFDVFDKALINNEEYSFEMGLQFVFLNNTSLNSVTFHNYNSTIFNNVAGLFSGCTSLTSVTFPNNIDTSNLNSFYIMFENCSSLESLDLSMFDLTTITNMNGMFQGCSSLTEIEWPESATTPKLESMDYMFKGCSSLTSIDLSSFSSELLTSMLQAFDGCTAVTEIKFGDNFTASSVSNMNYLFLNLTSLKELDLSKFVTTSLTTMIQTFTGCSNLSELTFGEGFTTSKVTDMTELFNGCSSLTDLKIDMFDTSNITTFEKFFNECSSLQTLTIDPDKFKSTNVTSTKNMFYNCNSLESLDLSGITKGNTTFAVQENMLYKTNSLSTIYLDDLSALYLDKYDKDTNTERIFYREKKDDNDYLITDIMIPLSKDQAYLDLIINYPWDLDNRYIQIYETDGLTSNLLYRDPNIPTPSSGRKRKKEVKVKPVTTSISFVNGYYNGKKNILTGKIEFKPYETITNNEAISMLSSIFNDEKDYNNFIKIINEEKKTNTNENENKVLNKIANIFNSINDEIKNHSDISRIEFATVVYKLLNLKEVSLPNDFENQLVDTKDTWYEEIVNKLVYSGIIKGYDDMTFKADEKINVLEACIIINRITKPTSENKDNIFSDITEDDWFYEEAIKAIK